MSIRAELELAIAELRASNAAQQRAIEGLHRAIEDVVNTTVNEPSIDLPPVTQHRREHRSGRPAKIDADPELRAFIIARIERMTFPEIAQAVASQFPAERRVGKSAIYDWWKRSGRAGRTRTP